MKKKIMTVTLNPCIDKTITLNGFCEGGLNRASDVRVDAGGKGVNVAKVLKQLDADVLAVGALGDSGSEKLLRELKERGITADFLTISGETRTNYKLFDRVRGQVTEINEPGFSVGEEEIQGMISLIEKHLPQVDVMVLAGSLAPGFPKELYGSLTRLARSYGTKVIVDADGESFSSALKAGPYAIKPNRFELEQFFGKTLSSDEELLCCGRALLEKGVSLVAISLGADGAVYVTKNEAFRVKLAPVKCQSTVGAGDSMVAAIASCISEGTDLKALASMASAAGTATASKPGTEVCTQEELQAYQKLLTIIKM